MEGFDPLTNRRGRATSQLQVEGQSVDVTILEAPRGTVTGFVVNADGVTPVPAARVALVSSSFIETRLQATALANGSFRFEGVPAGSFTLDATDPVSGFTGSATGTLTFEGETVDTNVPLAPFGSVHVTVLDAARPAGVQRVGDDRQARRRRSIRTGSSRSRTSRSARITSSRARSPTRTTAATRRSKIESANQVAEAIVRLRGVGSVTVTVVPASAPAWWRVPR